MGLLLSQAERARIGKAQQEGGYGLRRIRVLVVDDSASCASLIPQILQSDSSIQVVGTAMDGNFGLKKIEEVNPQVVTLDLDMRAWAVWTC